MECFAVEKDGFYGFLHEPTTGPSPDGEFSGRFTGKALIVLGGSEGNENIPRNLGARFAREGVAALGLCYWNVPGLPDELVEVPVESVERACALLRSRGYERIGIYGISKGGELALLAASLMPDLTCAVALSPLDHVMPGITGSGGLASKGVSTRSSWTWRSESLGCAPGGIRLPYLGIIRRMITERQLDMRFVYERMLEGASATSAIKVERINGPVMLISPEHDSMWPSDEACRRIERRLRAQDHPWGVARVTYEHASHIIVPMETDMLRLFREERRFPQECSTSREDAFRRTLAFLEQW